MEKAKYSRQYFEAYAKYSLQYNYNSNYKALRKGESPDFKSNSLDLGIEVTRAISKNDGRVWSYINYYYGKKMHDSKIKNQTNKEYSGRFKTNQNMIGEATYFSSDLDTNQVFEKVMNTVERKTMKLNTIYKIFKRNYLYIFGETGLFDGEMLKHLKTEIEKLDFKIKYDIIFINAIDRILVIDFEKNRIEERNIKEDVHHICQQKALNVSRIWEKKID